MATESLRQKQSRFVLMLAQLFQYADSKGYALTLGEAYRSDEQAEINALGTNGRGMLSTFIQAKFPLLAAAIRNNTGSGIRNSLHTQRLALDLMLFNKSTGTYLPATEDHRALGEFWESLGGTWGGRFNDGGHYSLEHNGVK